MIDIVSLKMTPQQQKLWHKIQAFELDDPTSAMTFTDRLARENNWDTQYAVAAVTEYKKFMLLLCITSHPLTPSDQVDQVWHLHLLYTQLYWTDFCQNILGRQIHHGPTKGGSNETTKYTNWYNKTLSLYKDIFGVDAPKSIWPDDKIRFNGANFKRVNTNDYWIIKKPRL
ncbi:glycine-rich domain-containing protein [Flavobacterium subsaxonicum]|nr:hypothetical protein [Flavobacterium subsaxonicum]